MNKKLFLSTLLLGSLYAPTILGMQIVDMTLPDKSKLRIGIYDTQTQEYSIYNTQGTIAASIKKLPTNYCRIMTLTKNDNRNILKLTDPTGSQKEPLIFDLSNVNSKLIEIMQAIDTKNQQWVITHTPYTTATMSQTIYLQQNS